MPIDLTPQPPQGPEGNTPPANVWTPEQGPPQEAIAEAQRQQFQGVDPAVNMQRLSDNLSGLQRITNELDTALQNTVGLFDRMGSAGEQFVRLVDQQFDLGAGIRESARFVAGTQGVEETAQGRAREEANRQEQIRRDERRMRIEHEVRNEIANLSPQQIEARLRNQGLIEPPQAPRVPELDYIQPFTGRGEARYSEVLEAMRVPEDTRSPRQREVLAGVPRPEQQRIQEEISRAQLESQRVLTNSVDANLGEVRDAFSAENRNPRQQEVYERLTAHITEQEIPRRMAYTEMMDRANQNMDNLVNVVVRSWQAEEPITVAGGPTQIAPGVVSTGGEQGAHGGAMGMAGMALGLGGMGHGHGIGGFLEDRPGVSDDLNRGVAGATAEGMFAGGGLNVGSVLRMAIASKGLSRQLGGMSAGETMGTRMAEGRAMGGMGGMLRMGGALLSRFAAPVLIGTDILRKQFGFDVFNPLGSIRDYTQSGRATGEGFGAGMAVRGEEMKLSFNPFDMITREIADQIVTGIRQQGFRGQQAQRLEMAVGGIYQRTGIDPRASIELMTEQLRGSTDSVEAMTTALTSLHDTARESGLGLQNVTNSFQELMKWIQPSATPGTISAWTGAFNAISRVMPSLTRSLPQFAQRIMPYLGARAGLMPWQWPSPQGARAITQLLGPQVRMMLPSYDMARQSVPGIRDRSSYLRFLQYTYGQAGGILEGLNIQQIRDLVDPRRQAQLQREGRRREGEQIQRQARDTLHPFDPGRTGPFDFNLLGRQSLWTMIGEGLHHPLRSHSGIGMIRHPIRFAQGAERFLEHPINAIKGLFGFGGGGGPSDEDEQKYVKWLNTQLMWRSPGRDVRMSYIRPLQEAIGTSRFDAVRKRVEHEISQGRAERTPTHKPQRFVLDLTPEAKRLVKAKNLESGVKYSQYLDGRGPSQGTRAGSGWGN